jgi:hypothetical protein
MLLMFNADHANTINFVLPPLNGDNDPWEIVLDTADESLTTDSPVVDPYPLQSCSVVVLRSRLKVADPT